MELRENVKKIPQSGYFMLQSLYIPLIRVIKQLFKLIFCYNLKGQFYFYFLALLLISATPGLFHQAFSSCQPDESIWRLNRPGIPVLWQQRHLIQLLFLHPTV